LFLIDAQRRCKKVSSVHPAAIQMEYQAEVPKLAPSGYTHMLPAYPKAVRQLASPLLILS